jgi:hypothetical protein
MPIASVTTPPSSLSPSNVVSASSTPTAWSVAAALAAHVITLSQVEAIAGPARVSSVADPPPGGLDDCLPYYDPTNASPPAGEGVFVMVYYQWPPYSGVTPPTGAETLDETIAVFSNTTSAHAYVAAFRSAIAHCSNLSSLAAPSVSPPIDEAEALRQEYSNDASVEDSLVLRAGSVVCQVDVSSDPSTPIRRTPTNTAQFERVAITNLQALIGTGLLGSTSS